MWKYFLLLFCCCHCCLLSIHAQTVTWSQPPTYQTLEDYGDVYKVRENGKVGIVSRAGRVLVRADYDSITPFNEQLALGLDIQNGKYVVKSVINQPDYQLSAVAGHYYVQEGELYFSNRKLAVYDDRGRYGYLLPDGTLFIQCRYARAYPFYEGLACVYKDKDRVTYLKSDGSELVTEVEHQGYVLVAGTAFNEKGEACIQGRLAGTKAFVIDKNGRTLREAKFSGNRPKNFVFRKSFEFPVLDRNTQPANGVEPFKQGNLYGYVLSDGSRTILSPQFAEAHSFRGGFAKVKLNGEYGILQLQLGTFAGQMDKSKVQFKNGKEEKVNYTVSIPPSYKGKSIRMIVSKEGVSKEVPLTIEDGLHATYTFLLNPVNQEENMLFHISLVSEGLLLWEDEQALALEYIKDLPPTLSVPQITSVFSTDVEGYVRADSNNKVDVYTTITNRASSPLQITVSIEGKGVESVTMELIIPAEGNKVVSTSIKDIKERKPVKVVVRTSTGLEQSSVIKVKPFI